MGPNDIQKLNQVAQAAAIDAAKKKAIAAQAAAKQAEDQAKAAQKPTTAAPTIGQQSNEEAGEELAPGTRVEFSNEGGRETLEGEVIPYSSDLEDEDTGGAVSDYHIEGGILIRANDGEIFHRQVDDVEVLSGSEDEDAEVTSKPHAWSPSCDCPKCHAAYAKENERRRKAGLSHESADITNFLKAVSQKNYAAANKYLQGVVESKLKRSISKAANK